MPKFVDADYKIFFCIVIPIVNFVVHCEHYVYLYSYQMYTAKKILIICSTSYREIHREAHTDIDKKFMFPRKRLCRRCLASATVLLCGYGITETIALSRNRVASSPRYDLNLSLQPEDIQFDQAQITYAFYRIAGTSLQEKNIFIVR